MYFTVIMPKKSDYDAALFEPAIKEVKEGKSIRGTAKKYGLPKSTLEFKLKNPGHKDTCGPSSILSSEEETLLEK